MFFFFCIGYHLNPVDWTIHKINSQCCLIRRLTLKGGVCCSSQSWIRLFRQSSASLQRLRACDGIRKLTRDVATRQGEMGVSRKRKGEKKEEEEDEEGKKVGNGWNGRRNAG